MCNLTPFRFRACAVTALILLGQWCLLRPDSAAAQCNFQACCQLFTSNPNPLPGQTVAVILWGGVNPINGCSPYRLGGFRGTFTGMGAAAPLPTSVISGLQNSAFLGANVGSVGTVVAGPLRIIGQNVMRACNPNGPGPLFGICPPQSSADEIYRFNFTVPTNAAPGTQYQFCYAGFASYIHDWRPSGPPPSSLWCPEFEPNLVGVECCTTITVAGNPNPQGCVTPPSQMVGWWHFDESTGNLAADIAGSFPNNGTIVGGSHSPGKVSNAICLNGSTQYVDVPDQAELNFGPAVAGTALGDLSIDAWINVGPSILGSGVSVIVDKRTIAADVQGYSFYLFNGQLAFQLATNGGGSPVCANIPSSSCTNYGSGFTVLADNLWHHVAVTVDRDNSSGIVFYYDGVPVGTPGDPVLRSGSLVNNSPLRIGARSSSLSAFFPGCIDELELFDRVLHPGEVLGLYQADRYGKCKDRCLTPPTQMVLWYPFDELAGTTANDIAGSANNLGTLDNGFGAVFHAPGKVANALCFDFGYVQTPDHPELNFGASTPGTTNGDFSMDAWVRIGSAGHQGIQILVDKRVETSGDVQGYSWFLANGQMALQLATDGGLGNFCANNPGFSCTNYGSGFTVPADNQWHLLAVTVDRDSQTGIRWYFDGVAVGVPANPSVRTGSLINTSPLRVGCRSSSLTGFFVGCMDELEIFNRVLLPAEIQAIFNADEHGKCKDCNGNGQPDDEDIATGVSADCNMNGIPDECERPDCNTNGVLDECEQLIDCDLNGIPDICQSDYVDCNSNGVPDWCELLTDCNTNGISDLCEYHADCNANGVPDECENPDCNTNDIPDICEGLFDCNTNGVPDICEFLIDCNHNGIPDICERLRDCNTNGIPDVCEYLPDCNTNNTPDVCEGLADCNSNGVPDICDIRYGTSRDCDGNGVPDECRCRCPRPLTQICYDAGCNDNFALPPDPVVRSPQLNALYPSGNWKGFDDATSNRLFGYTFQNLPSGICEATLEIRMRPHNDIPSNDSINLCVTGGSPAFAWGRAIAALSTTGTWNAGQAAQTFCLNLADLPNANGTCTSVIPCMNANRRLDVFVQDDTAIDYMRLIIRVCPCETRPREFRGGIRDNFAPAPPAEPAVRGACLNSLRAANSWKNFDDLSPNRGVGHTFTGLPGGIVRAELEVRMRPHSDIPSNDSINLALSCECGGPRFLWGSHIRNLPGAGGTWNNGGPARTFVLDLGSMVPSNMGSTCADCMNILGHLARGTLDVYVQDDTAVDYMFLRVWSCPRRFIFDGVTVNTDGNATVSLPVEPGGGLYVGNIGGTGQDGVEFAVGEAQGICVGLPICPSGYGMGTALSISASGNTFTEPVHLGDLDFQSVGTHVELHTDFSPNPAPCTWVVVCLNNVEVMRQCVTPGNVASIPNSACVKEIDWLTINSQSSGFSILFDGPIVVTYPNGAMVTGDRVKIYPDFVTGGLAPTLSSLSIRSALVPEFTIPGLKVQQLGVLTMVTDDNTGLEPTYRRLPIRNLGSTGQDGVAIQLPPTSHWSVAVDPIDPEGTAPNGASVHTLAMGDRDGMPNQPLGSIEYRRIDSFFDVFADFTDIGATGHRVQVLSGGTLLYDVTGPPAQVGQTDQWPVRIGKIGGPLECFVIRHPVGTTFHIGGQTLAGDELRVLAIGATAQIGDKTAALLQFTGLEVVVLSDVVSEGPCDASAFLNTESFTVNNPDWVYRGVSSYNGTNGTARLTNSGVQNTAGLTFLNTPHSSGDFEVEFDFRITNVVSPISDQGGFPGPDGVVFIVCDTPPAAPGNVGRDLGYGGLPGVSHAIEFDAFWNPAVGDQDTNHVGLNVGGSVVSIVANPVTPNFESGTGNWHARIREVGGQITVFVRPPGGNEMQVLSAPVPPAHIPAVKYFGFSSGTGLNSATVDIDNVRITGLQPDCNHNNKADECDINGGNSYDCNTNGVPDECDINNGSADANMDGVLDICQDVPCTIGDLNLDGLGDGDDIQPFIDCLLEGDSGSGTCSCGDMNADGALTLDDVPAFIQLLSQ